MTNSRYALISIIYLKSLLKNFINQNTPTRFQIHIYIFSLMSKLFRDEWSNSLVIRKSIF